MPIINKNLLIILYEKQKGKCAYCGCSLLEEANRGINPHFDHIDPKSKKGKDEIDNLCLTCDWCNRVKSNKTVEEFLEYIKPYLDGKVKKEDLSDFKKYKKLHKKFKSFL